MATEELWHLVEARREDGAHAMFRIRDLAPRLEQPRILVIEIPYPLIGLARLPDAAAYRRLAQFEEQWLTPAATALAWTFVAAKTEDGSFFLYLYGAGDPQGMIERLSPFDGALGFFEEHDPIWDEYAALRELLDQANAMPAELASGKPPGRARPAVTAAPANRPTKPAAKPAPANKSAAKKAPAKTSAAKKSPANKSAAKKPPANKSAAKSVPPQKQPRGAKRR